MLQRPVLRIGVYLPLSGAGLTTNGPEIYDGMMLLINKINAERIGPYAINASMCDDQYILAKAKACWRRFAVEDPVQIVLGGHTSFTVDAGNYFEPFGILNIQ
jgi:ABC-type branched-subunit amino acid transport system substrate-binding protein